MMCRKNKIVVLSFMKCLSYVAFHFFEMKIVKSKDNMYYINFFKIEY